MAVCWNRGEGDSHRVMNMKGEVCLGNTHVGLVESWLSCSVGVPLIRGVSPARRRILMEINVFAGQARATQMLERIGMTI